MDETYRLREDAQLEARDDGSVVARQSRFQLTLDRLSVGRRALLLRLAEGWVGHVEISQLVANLEGEKVVVAAQVLLRRLIAHSWLERRLSVDGRPLLDVLPRRLGADSQRAAARCDPGVGYRLSRFAELRPDRDALVAGSPLGDCAIACVEPRLGAALARAAGGGCDAAALAHEVGLGGDDAGRLLDELVTARILLTPADAAAERDEPPLAFWAPEELALHDRSRPGRHVLPLGGTYRFRGRVAPPTARHEFVGATRVELPYPDLDAIAKADDSLTGVIRARRTIRSHDDDRPMTLEQLGEFLARVQRTTDISEPGGGPPADGGEKPGGVPTAGADAAGRVPTAGAEVAAAGAPAGDGEAPGRALQTARRPYPTGGSVCELEVYALVNRCAGLDPGFYHYESVGHALELLPSRPVAGKIVSYARAAAGMAGEPQVILVVTARVQRLMWKYEGMSYALILKHAGILTELMYLVATAMGLAPCALGAGDSAAFAALSGLDPMVEPSVADFLLGSRRPEDESEHGPADDAGHRPAPSRTAGRTTNRTVEPGAEPDHRPAAEPGDRPGRSLAAEPEEGR